MNTQLPQIPKRTKSKEIAIIKEAVAQEFQVTVDEIDNDERREPLPMIRHVAMYLAYKIVYCSLPEVARAFHRQSHGVVLHAIKVTEARREISPIFAARVDRVTKVATDLVEATRKGSK